MLRGFDAVQLAAAKDSGCEVLVALPSSAASAAPDPTL
jgi:hypothetical protein